MKTSDIFRFRGFKALALTATSIVSALGFFWPFINSENKSATLFWIATPLSLLLLLALIGRANLDPKTLALLAVMSAVVAALRPLGAGAAGIEPMWFILILTSYVFGSSFGFLLGVQSMLLSAFLTGGFGPWLPYQIFAAGWMGLIAGIAPKIKNKKLEISLLVVLSAICAEIFGILMDLQFWPWTLGPKTQLSFIPGGAIADNFHRFIVYHLTTSMAWDVPRAIFTAALIILVGPGVLATLKRSARRANFKSEIYFT